MNPKTKKNLAEKKKAISKHWTGPVPAFPKGSAPRKRKPDLLRDHKAVNLAKNYGSSTIIPLPDPGKIVGLMVKAHRDDQEFSQYALAKAAGVQIAQLQNIESGTSSYTFVSLIKVCKALGIKNIPITY